MKCVVVLVGLNSSIVFCQEITKAYHHSLTLLISSCLISGKDTPTANRDDVNSQAHKPVCPYLAQLRLSSLRMFFLAPSPPPPLPRARSPFNLISIAWCPLTQRPFTQWRHLQVRASFSDQSWIKLYVNIQGDWAGKPLNKLLPQGAIRKSVFSLREVLSLLV